MPRQYHGPYPKEFKQTIIDLARSGRSAEDLAKEFGCSGQTIRNWVAQVDADAGRRNDVLTTDEREELRASTPSCATTTASAWVTSVWRV